MAGGSGGGRCRPGRRGGRLGPAITCRPVNKSELESKHLAELHALAADAGIERYRMLPRTELVERLADGAGGAEPKSQAEPKAPRGDRSGEPRRRNRSRNRKPREQRQPSAPKAGQGDEPPAEPERRPKPTPPSAAAPTPPPARSKRKRRRRWGRRRKGIRVYDLLLPASDGRQAIVYGEGRASCTALLREVASELSGASKGPDPIALLIDPSPEELAEWRREAPKAEIVAAGKAQHADDAIAQAVARAGSGEDVIVLIDSLTRFVESFAGTEEARELFDAGAGVAGGSLTVVAAVERS